MSSLLVFPSGGSISKDFLHVSVVHPSLNNKEKNILIYPFVFVKTSFHWGHAGPNHRDFTVLPLRHNFVKHRNRETVEKCHGVQTQFNVLHFDTLWNECDRVHIWKKVLDQFFFCSTLSANRKDREICPFADFEPLNYHFIIYKAGRGTLFSTLKYCLWQKISIFPCSGRTGILCQL